MTKKDPHQVAFEDFIKKNPRILRDKNRIKQTLDLIRTYWEQNPDLRLGQIIGNFTDNGKDPYYLEDTDLIEKLKGALKHGNKE